MKEPVDYSNELDAVCGSCGAEHNSDINKEWCATCIATYIHCPHCNMLWDHNDPDLRQVGIVCGKAFHLPHRDYAMYRCDCNAIIMKDTECPGGKYNRYSGVHQ
jgi:hypothetical protein